MSELLFAVLIVVVGLERLGVTANLGPAPAALLIACCAPLILFGSAYLTIISAFAKSYREAQTYLQLVVTIPTYPILTAQVDAFTADEGELELEVRDLGAEVSSFGWYGELGVAGEVWGPLGYSVRARYTSVKDTFTGASAARG